jgi:hypothetical protein
MSIAEIKSAIEALSENERCELHAWLQNWPSDDWDRQMESDTSSGKLASLAREADDIYSKNEYRLFPRRALHLSVSGIDFMPCLLTMGIGTHEEYNSF